MKLAAIIALLASCGRAPDYTTDLGVEVYTGGLDIRPYEVDEAARIQMQFLQAVEPSSRPSDLNGLEVHFSSSLVECDGADEAGCFHHAPWGSVIHVRAINTCLADTELVHELNHWAQHTYDRSGGHDDHAMFLCPSSVEVRAQEVVCEELCGGVCAAVGYYCPSQY